MSNEYSVDIENEVPDGEIESQNDYIYALINGNFTKINIKQLKEHIAAGNDVTSMSKEDYILIAQSIIAEEESEEDDTNPITKISVENLASVLYAIIAEDKGVITKTAIEQMFKTNNFVKKVDLSEDKTELIISYYDETEIKLPYVSSGGGLSFDGGYVDDDNKLHLQLNGEDIEGFDPITLPAGGNGGGGSQLVFAVTSGIATSVTDNSEFVPISIKFSSLAFGTPTGKGNMSVYINDILYRTLEVEQGDHAFENLIPVSELNANSNTIKLIMTDNYEQTATRKITVTKINLSLSWDIASETIRNDGNTYILNLTPKGSSGVKKDIVVTVKDSDGNTKEYTSSTTASNTPVPITLENLSTGSYIIEAKCSMVYNGTEINSNVLRAAIAQINDVDDVVIASSFIDVKAKQYTPIIIPYRVINGQSNTANVVLKAVDESNRELYKANVTVDAAQQEWNYKPSTTGKVKLIISCEGAEWLHTLEVDELALPIKEITANLDFKLDPASMTSLDGLILSNKFDRFNGGLVTDADGIRCLRVMKGDRLTIPYQLFNSIVDVTGKEIKIIYKVENVTDMDTTAIECYSDSIGLKLNANDLICRSSQSELTMETCEEIKTELDINIASKSNNRTVEITINGIPTKSAQYAASDDKFRQSNPVGITVGSDECNVSIYLIRSYTRYLSDTELTTNFIMDAPDGDEIMRRYERNCIYSDGSADNKPKISGSLFKEFIASKCQNAHIFEIIAPNIPTGKEDENYVEGKLAYELGVKGSAGKFQRPISMKYKLQGTSSLDYIDSAANFDILLLENIIWQDGHEQPLFKISDTSIPIDYINLKVNDASSEHINNILLAEWFNRFQVWQREARKNNSSVRDTVEGDMCVIFYTNSGDSPVKAGSTTVDPGETVLYALGNVNNSKKNNAVFGQDDEDDICCVEINNNTSDKCRFKTKGVSKDDFGDELPFGVRYMSKKHIPEGSNKQTAAAALWKDAYNFVVDCNPDEATNLDLAKPVVYEINKSGETKAYAVDTPEYRKMKFRNELKNYFIVDTLIYHYIITLFFCMVDNRAKNTFYGYSKKLNRWHLCFGYDFDTSMGINNVGELKMSYGYLDTDRLDHNEDAGFVYNAADSTMFTLIKEAFPEEIKDMYQKLETAGCFDMDAFNNLCKEYQSKFCEALIIEDYRKKYYGPLKHNNDATYLEKANGTKELQRMKFTHFQAPFISSYFISDFCKKNQASFRSYGTANIMTVTPYLDQFITFIGGNIVKQVRGFKGVPVTIDISDFKANDSETYIRNAPFIMDLGDLSDFKMASCEFDNFKKLKSIIIGSEQDGYVNNQLTVLNVSKCEALEILNIANCIKFGSKGLDLKENLLLKQLNTVGTIVSAIIFANGGQLQNAKMNAVTGLVMKNLNQLETLDFNANELTSITIEGGSYNNIGNLLEAATKLANVRAVDIQMELTTSALLKRLLNVGGWDADGHETTKAVVTGACFILAISETVYATMRTLYPDLSITHGDFVPEHTVSFTVDGKVVETQKVEHGGSAIKPETDPTKESSASTDYEFAGWGASFDNIIEDTEIPAIFRETPRKYLVRYIDGMTIMQESYVEYGDSCRYTGADISKSGYLFDGWQDLATNEVDSFGRVENIEHDVYFQAHYISPTLPNFVATDYDYLASEDPADYEPDANGRKKAAYTWAEFYGVIIRRMAATYFIKSDTDKAWGKLIKCITSSASIGTLLIRLVDLDHCRLASDETQTAHTVWQTLGVLNYARTMHSSNSNIGGYPITTMSTYMDGTIYSAFSPLMRSMIKEIKLKSTIGNMQADTVWSSHKVWLPSQREVGLSGATEMPYANEVDELSARAVFPVYTSASSRIKKTYNNEGTAVYWWLRSPYSGGSGSFCVVNNNGGSHTNNANTTSNYMAPCFCI